MVEFAPETWCEVPDVDTVQSSSPIRNHEIYFLFLDIMMILLYGTL